MKSPTVHILSLGCAKNSVDSESMGGLLVREGFRLTRDPRKAQVLVVNTCGFIGPAREESLETLRRLAKGKQPGQLLIAAGCLTQRYGAEVAGQVDGIDGILGTRRWMDIVQVVQTLRAGKSPSPLYHLPEGTALGMEANGIPRTALQGASAYLKIADGCRRPCAFCAIPLIKGTAVSRSPERILAEARTLQDQGIREIILIAQDTTDYGHDLGLRDGLAHLINGLVAEAPGVDWFRVMYAYPGFVSDRLIEVMATHPACVHYLDMPLQHAHPSVLRRMRRPANVESVRRTLEKLRKAMPDIALRTTFLVGYPGETEAEFQELLDFVADARFERVGVFTFSFELGTASEPLGDPVPQEAKEERRERLMRLQQGISLQSSQAQVGRSVRVLIEGKGDGISLGRSYRDAPEIDGMVIVDGKIAPGIMADVLITGAMTYDLSGVLVGQEGTS